MIKLISFELDTNYQFHYCHILMHIYLELELELQLQLQLQLKLEKKPVLFFNN